MRLPLQCCIALALALAGCGRDGVSPTTASGPQSHAVQGAIVKGPLVGATVNFFHVDDAGQPTGTPVGTVVSDAQGHVSASLPSSNELLIAVTSGGSYVDESDDAGGDNRRRITLGDNEGFQSIVPANATTFAITPFSMAILLRARQIANGGNFGAVYPAVLSQAQAVFGFDPTSLVPDDPLAPNLDTPEAAKYGLLLGGAAYAINSIAIAQGVPVTYQTIIAFIEDLSDGILDGAVNGTTVEFKAVVVGGNTITINGETLRFRNNHYDLYQNLLASINEGAWSDVPPDLPTDLPPIAHGDSITVEHAGNADELDSGADSVLDNDSSTGGEPLTAHLETSPSHGDLTLNPDGTFHYHHDGSDTKTDSFTYTAHTATASSSPATVNITITSPGNGCQSHGGGGGGGGGDDGGDDEGLRKASQSTDELVACPDHYPNVQCGSFFYVPPPGVLHNDSFPPGGEEDPFDVEIVDYPHLGSLFFLDDDGSFEYFASCFGNDENDKAAKAASTKPDSFRYRLHYEGQTSNETSVNLTVDFSCGIIIDGKASGCCIVRDGKATECPVGQ